jgi:hypothetical protein
MYLYGYGPYVEQQRERADAEDCCAAPLWCYVEDGGTELMLAAGRRPAVQAPPPRRLAGHRWGADSLTRRSRLADARRQPDDGLVHENCGLRVPSIGLMTCSAIWVEYSMGSFNKTRRQGGPGPSMAPT